MGIARVFGRAKLTEHNIAILKLNAVVGVTGFANKDGSVKATSKPAALHVYQLSIPAPKPPAGSVNLAAFEKGKKIFEGPGKCATCHVPPLFTEPGENLHSAEEIGVDFKPTDPRPASIGPRP